MPAHLVADEGHRILIDKPIVLFGRDAECDVQFDSRKISRRHCCIAQIGNELVVRDLGSTNGIRINGVRVLEGRLQAGDELAIGNHRYEVRWDALAPGQEKLIVRKVADPRVGVNGSAADEPSSRMAVPAELEAVDEPPPSEKFPLDAAQDLPTPLIAPPPAPDAEAPLPLPPEDDPEPFSIVPDELKLAPSTSDVPLQVHPRKPSPYGGHW